MRSKTPIETRMRKMAARGESTFMRLSVMPPKRKSQSELVRELENQLAQQLTTTNKRN